MICSTTSGWEFMNPVASSGLGTVAPGTTEPMNSDSRPTSGMSTPSVSAMSPAIAANPPVPVNTNSPRTADHCELGSCSRNWTRSTISSISSARRIPACLNACS